ncbi:hypothetical protein, partial [Vibrio parahaemolyticus]|uniref:hypothetical protein n=1 Tax=Vibrio parahaemolyticus TaxID=670 RepID=UPI001E284993
CLLSFHTGWFEGCTHTRFDTMAKMFGVLYKAVNHRCIGILIDRTALIQRSSYTYSIQDHSCIHLNK